MESMVIIARKAETVFTKKSRFSCAVFCPEISVHGGVLLKQPLHLIGQSRPAVQPGIGGQKVGGILLGSLEGAGVGHQVGQLQGRQTVLPFAEKVAGAPVFQVVAGDGEAVGGVAQKLQPP